MSPIAVHSAPNGTTNGSTSYGEAVVDGLLEKASTPSAPSKSSIEDVQLTLQSFRLLIADLCEQFGMGHPGFVSPAICTAILTHLA